MSRISQVQTAIKEVYDDPEIYDPRTGETRLEGPYIREKTTGVVKYGVPVSVGKTC
jgi:hypothetical protein